MPFHVSPIPRTKGDIIKCGWFGQNLCLNPPDIQVREYFYEIARLEFSPTSPSRLRSCYFFANQADAQQFLATRHGIGTIYEVDIVNQAAPVHRHCVGAHNNIPVYDAGGLNAKLSTVESYRFWLHPTIYSSNTECFAESDLIVL